MNITDYSTREEIGNRYEAQPTQANAQSLVSRSIVLVTSIYVSWKTYDVSASEREAFCHAPILRNRKTHASYLP